MTTLTDKRLESNRPDITILNKSSYDWILIGATLSWDWNIHEGETYENTEITILGRMNQKCTKKQLKMFLFWLGNSGLFPAIVL